MSQVSRSHEGRSLAGVRVALVGRFSGVSRRDAQRLVREHGGIALDHADASTGLVVVGDESAASNAFAARRFALREASLDASARALVVRGEIEVICESELWLRLGLDDNHRDIKSLYTLSMLAGLLKVETAVVRKWQRRGWIRPTRTIRRLAYFDFEQVLVARRLAELAATGVSLNALARQLTDWHQPGAEDTATLNNLAVVAGGRHLLRRQGEHLLGPSGQRWFSFVDETKHGVRQRRADIPSIADHADILPLTMATDEAAPSPETLVEMAEELEDQQELAAAADMYRAAAAAGGLTADLCFALAELLYRTGDLSAARERYFTAIELDENFVEARANLGCLLAEQGRLDLAVAALEGALRYHADYADAHYHLARILTVLGRRDEALPHWEDFLRLAPDSPWATEVRLLLALEEHAT